MHFSGRMAEDSLLLGPVEKACVTQSCHDPFSLFASRHWAPMKSEYWCNRGLRLTRHHGDSSTIEVVDKPYARVGRHAQCEFRLSRSQLGHASIRSVEYYVHATEQGIYLLPIRSRTTDGPIGRWLQPDEEIVVGECRLVFAYADGSPPPTPPATSPELPLEVNEQPCPVVSITLDGKPIAQWRQRRPLTLVGRSIPARIRIKHETVSSAHCVFYWVDGRLWVIDLLSRNGTRKDGRRFNVVRLRMGRFVSVGRMRLTFTREIHGELEGQIPNADVFLLQPDDGGAGISDSNSAGDVISDEAESWSSGGSHVGSDVDSVDSGPFDSGPFDVDQPRPLDANDADVAALENPPGSKWKWQQPVATHPQPSDSSEWVAFAEQVERQRRDVEREWQEVSLQKQRLQRMIAQLYQASAGRDQQSPLADWIDPGLLDLDTETQDPAAAEFGQVRVIAETPADVDDSQKLSQLEDLLNQQFAELESAREETERLKRDLQGVREQETVLSRQVADRQAELKEVQRQLERSEALAASLEGVRRSAEVALLAAEQLHLEVLQHRSREEARSEEITQLAAQSSALSEQVEDYRSLLAELKSDFDQSTRQWQARMEQQQLDLCDKERQLELRERTQQEEANRRLAELQRREAELAGRQADLEQILAERKKAQSQEASRVKLWEEELQARSDSLQQQHAEWERLQSEHQQRVAEFEAQCADQLARLEAEQQDLLTQSEQAETTWNERANELEASQREIEQTLDDLAAEREKQNAQRDELARQTEQLDQQKVELEELAASLAGEQEAIQDQASQLEKQGLEIEQQRSQLAESLDDLATERAKLATDQEAAKLEHANWVAEVTEELDRERDGLKSEQAELSVARQELDDLLQATRDRHSAAEQLASELAAREQAVAAREQELAAAEDQHRESLEHWTLEREQVDALQRQLAQEQSELEASRLALLEREQALQAEQAQLQQSQEQLLADKSGWEQEAAALEQELLLEKQTQERQLQQREMELTEREGLYQDQLQQEATWQQQAEQLRIQLEGSESQRVDLTRNLDELSQQKQAYDEKLERLQEELALAHHDVQELEKRQAEFRGQEDSLAQRLVELTRREEQLDAKAEQQAAELQAQASDARRAMEVDIATLRSSLAEMRDQLQTQQEEATRQIAASRVEAEREREKFASERAALDQQRRDLEREQREWLKQTQGQLREAMTQDSSLASTDTSAGGRSTAHTWEAGAHAPGNGHAGERAGEAAGETSRAREPAGNGHLARVEPDPQFDQFQDRFLKVQKRKWWRFW